MEALAIEETAENEIEAQEETSAEVETPEVETEDSTEEVDEIVVTIGDEEAPASEEEPAPNWAKELRIKHRETAKEYKRLKEKLEAVTAPETTVEKPADKPTLESCDYDELTFEESLAGWYEQKRKYDDSQKEVEREQEKQQQEWQKVQNAYVDKKTELKVPDEVEQVVTDELNETQQAILIKHADNPALVVMGLGNNPQKLDELSKIKDPIAFALAMKDIERATKINKQTRPRVQPEKLLEPSSSVSVSASDKQLEALEKEAEKTGDRTKILAYKRELTKR